MCYTFVMLRVRLLFALLCVVALAANAAPQSLAPTPPLGWNSWDAYGLTIDEAQYRDNVKVLAGLKQYGWEYAVIDEGWYMQDPLAYKVATREYVWDANGNLIPAVDRFPSSRNGAGFKPLADWVHEQGLKFGIHIVRGIPRQVVKENLPIAGTSFRAQDAADIQATCPWDEGNYGVSDTPAGQAYYDGMLKLYASWGLDFLKVDCISDHPYRPTRDPPGGRSDSQDGTADRAEPFAGADVAEACGRSGEVLAVVAHHGRSLGRVGIEAAGERQRISVRAEPGVRPHCAVAAVCEAGQLARSGYAA